MPSANRETLTTRFVEALPVSDREIVVWDRERLQKSQSSNPCTSGQRIGLNGRGDMSTLGYHFPEFAIGAVVTV